METLNIEVDGSKAIPSMDDDKAAVVYIAEYDEVVSYKEAQENQPSNTVEHPTNTIPQP